MTKKKEEQPKRSILVRRAIENIRYLKDYNDILKKQIIKLNEIPLNPPNFNKYRLSNFGTEIINENNNNNSNNNNNNNNNNNSDNDSIFYNNDQPIILQNYRRVK